MILLLFTQQNVQSADPTGERETSKMATNRMRSSSKHRKILRTCSKHVPDICKIKKDKDIQDFSAKQQEKFKNCAEQWL